MSGVMIKTGIYGLLRALTFLGSPPSWWGWTLLIVGAASGLLGVLHALAQHDLKRLLAYHSVENIGIIALGLGLGLLGVSHRLPLLAALGLAGGLLHVLNHALFKSLLFLGAGAVDCAAGTREMDRLGGLLKKMPVTGVGFLIGSAAISGLPPLNGFVSEFLIYLGAGRGLLLEGAASPAPTVAGLAVIGSLAIIGGLAAACFAKAFGIVFLGEPRRPSVLPTGEVPWGMRLPMVLLAALCLAGGLLAPLALQAVRPAVILLAGPGSGAAELESGLAGAASALSAVVRLSVLLLALLLGIALLRRLALSGKEVRTEVTWDCGYAAPTPRMQYTASSFAGSITGSFQLLLHSGRRVHPPQGYFPAPASLRIEPRDPFLRGLFRPLFRAVSWAAIRLRWLQQGSIQLYILYIALTILVLLVWKLE
jgi:formate hydrogenlyase subunit 3/multisubunit Na+/H+ antiporter MnhD subunit